MQDTAAQAAVGLVDLEVAPLALPGTPTVRAEVRRNGGHPCPRSSAVEQPPRKRQALGLSPTKGSNPKVATMAERKPWQRTGPDTRIRGSAGQKLRARRLARTHGLCEMCEAEGLSTLATVVNHKVRLADGGLDVDENTENLCKRHDDEVTAAQAGKRLAVEGKGVDRSGRPTSGDHPWNRRA